MAALGDVFVVNYVIETSGVATSTRMYFSITADKGPSTLAGNLGQLALQFWDSVKAIISVDATFSCMAYQNLTQNEKLTVFPQFPGIAPGGPHPSHQTLRVNRWGSKPGGPMPNRPVINAINLAGTAEEFSVRGRLDTSFNTDAMTNFQIAVADLGAGGWDVTPMVRKRIGVTKPAIYEYYVVEMVDVVKVFNFLAKRQSSLCATA